MDDACATPIAWESLNEHSGLIQTDPKQRKVMLYVARGGLAHSQGAVTIRGFKRL